ncbi:MAG: hypothetical protein EA382_11225 [Spirochaetaceae bacterium]|nr:MAG: hypothetical protein EA382_11225 [Spirochaetaceae bacterium]
MSTAPAPPIVDAYAHVGYPRYGTPEELASIWKQWGITKGNIALPPGMPDFGALAAARDAMGDSVRLFGIPYGEDGAARLSLAELQVKFGVAGMRLMPAEIADNPRVLDALGEAALCLMAINVYDRTDVTRAMITWLERYPNGIIAAPHFLRRAGIDGRGVEAGHVSRAVADPAAFRDLLRHPRMHAIFSRHGGCSAERFPHHDLRPWIDDVLPLLGWERVMWGSEIPVIYHRDEQVDGAIGWLRALGVAMSESDEAAYRGGNAERVFFAASSEHTGVPVDFPAWVRDGLRSFIDANEPVPVIRSGPLELPLDLHGRLMSAYLVAQRADPALMFQRWIVEQLRRVES